MLWTKAFHIISMVTWFSGLFYLPRLFVYHADAKDALSRLRFQTMEHKLYYYITTPGCLLTVLTGGWLIHYNPQGYLHMGWLHAKLFLVFLLLGYHLYLGKLLNALRHERSTHSSVFFRWINEIPTLFLISIVILAEVKPF